jgi:flavin-dependent dehydrogenase
MGEPFDVAVIGGGPAGGSVAIALSRAGRSVAVLERSGYEQPRIGETLPPEACIPLARLGVWDRFLEQGHAPSPGTASAWGQEEVEENHFVFNPYGSGWHLDRRRFDAMLASAATEAGVTFHRNARMTACDEASDGWRVDYVCDERLCRLHARFLVDATGRACIAARRHGARRIPFDRLIGVAGIFSQSSSTSEEDYRTLVEAVADGWWYSALLPQSRIMVAYMTDADLIPKLSEGVGAYWQSRLERTAYTHSRVKGLPLLSSIRIVSARSEALDRIAGRNWLATGDAAISFDPLSSQGIYYALKSGLLAARAIEGYLDGNPTAIAEVSNWTRESFNRYWQMHLLHYCHEQRWPDSLFWRRRRPGNEVQTRVMNAAVTN